MNRKGFIGGSDIAIILGVSPWKSLATLSSEKLGLIEPEDLSGRPDIQRGHYLEPIALKVYQDTYGQELTTDLKQIESAIGRKCYERRQDNKADVVAVHPDYPHFHAQVDAMLCPDYLPFEVKCPRACVYYKMTREGLPNYLNVQLQWELFVTGRDTGYWFIFCADGWEHLCFPVHYDEELMDGVILPAVERFWEDLEADRMPVESFVDPADVPGIPGERTIVRVGEKSPEFQRTWFAAMKRWEAAIAARKEAENVEKSIKEELKGVFSKPCSVEDGRNRITFSVSTSSRLDTKRFKREHPDLYEQYLKPTEVKKIMPYFGILEHGE